MDRSLTLQQAAGKMGTAPKGWDSKQSAENALAVFGSGWFWNGVVLNGPKSNRAELRVGGIFPLTGYLSWSGKYKRRAAELKVSMVNERGGIHGRPLKLIAYDDRSSVERAAKIAEALVFKHNVVAMIGTGSLPVSRAVAGVANRYRTPVFVNSGYAIDPLKDLFVFNTTHKTEYAVACSFQHFIEKGMNRLALLMPFGPLGEFGSWLARRLGRRMGIRIVGEERFDVASSDVIPQLRRLKALKPHALFSFVTGQPAASVSSAMAKVCLDLPLLVSHGNANPGFLRMVCRTPIHLIVPSGKSMVLEEIDQGDPCRRVLMEFNSRHMERFGEPANYYAAESADAIDLLAEGLRRTGDADPEKLRDAVESITSFVGMQGIYDLSPADHYGTCMEQIVLLSVKEGAWHFEKAFPSTSSLQDVQDHQKMRTIRVLADLLPASSGQSGRSQEAPYPNETAADPPRIPRIDHGGSPGLRDRQFFRQKMALIRSMREKDFRRGREILFHTMCAALMEHFDSMDKLKLMAFELFLDLIHTAMEDGNLDDLIRVRHSLLGQWQEVNDQESLCLWIVRVFETVSGTLCSRDEGGSADLFRRVIDFIEAHFAEDLTVERIAGDVCLSPSRLIHRMKNDHNSTIGKCIVKVRMEKAKTLLESTEVSIGVVAQEVGYKDQSYFTKVFKRQIGCTPKDYRDSSPASRFAPTSSISAVSYQK